MIAKLRTIMSMIFMDAQIEFKEHCRPLVVTHFCLFPRTFILPISNVQASHSPCLDEIKTQNIKNLSTRHYCLGSSNFPTGFSSFPGNMDGLLSSCSISHLEHIIPTASYNASISIAGRIVL